jgi:hypothetical protein
MDPLAQAAQQQTQQPQPTAEDALAATNSALIKKRQKETQDANNSFTAAQISQALAITSPKSKSPQVNVGKALNNNNYSNECLAYVDDQQGNKNRQPTAIADYQVNANAGNIQTKGTPPKGARVYFAPTPDNPAGHVALSDGGGSMTGATLDQGIETFKISDWEKYANQQYIGWAPPGSK